MSRPLQTWEFFIHTLQRVDVTCVEGQTAHITLVLKGASSTRQVQCFTSHPDEIKVCNERERERGDSPKDEDIKLKGRKKQTDRQAGQEI